ncbi:MAG TPA: tetratricopeptide repeat protein, partial [Thermoanaerobaculia bacterium]|nr:tetratricopeptide repeat protein [Thermoanaerobaculia bacterium]
MKNGKTLALAGATTLVAALAAAFLIPPRRTVTTSSAEAYREYLAGQDELHRMYMSEARRRFETALVHDPHFMMAMVSLAETDLGSNSAETKKWLGRANAERARVTRRERTAFDLVHAMSENRIDDATRFAIVLKDDYHDERGYSFLGSLASLQGRSDDANAIYREWLVENPNNAQAYNLLGYSSAYRGDYAEAIADLKKYAYLAPDEANPFDSLGEVEAANGRYEEAIRDLKKALSIKPDFTPSLLHLGVAYGGKGDFAAARTALEAAEQAYRDSPGQRLQVLLELQLLARRAGDLALEREAVARALALDLGDGPDARPLMRAALASDEGKYEEAIAYWKAFTPPAGTDEKVRALYARRAGLLRGRIEFAAGHMAEAIHWISTNLSESGTEGTLQDQASAIRYRVLLARAKAAAGDVAGAESLLAINRR